MQKLLSLTLFFASISITCQSQDVVPLFNTRVEVKYSALSPDGKFLAIATAGDSIVVKDAVTFLTRKIVTAFTSTTTMSDTYTGRKIFHITRDNQILYVLKRTSSSMIDLILRSEALETGKVNYEVHLTSIKKEDYESEKLYNHLTYGISVSGNTLVYFLNENIISIEIPSGKATNRWNVIRSKFAALSQDHQYLAIVTSDSLKVREVKSGRNLWHANTELNGLDFQGDSLITYGNDIVVFDARSGKKIKDLYYSPGFLYGMDVSADRKYLTFSNSYFTDNGFTATYNKHDLSLNSVFHLPKTEGYVSFFHPLTNQHWLVTTRGHLYRFFHNDNPIPIPQAGHRKTIRSFAFSKDHRSLLSASDEGEILLWDIPSSKVKERFNTNIPWMGEVIFDMNDEDLILLSEDSYRNIHRTIPTNTNGFANNIFSDPQDSLYVNEFMRRMSDHREKARQLAGKFGLDETKPLAFSEAFLAGQATNKLRIVALHTGEVNDFPVPDDLFGVQALAFYKPGILVTEGAYNTIVFVNVLSGKIIKRLGKQRSTYAKGIEHVLFNQGGDTLATVSNQNIQLWDLRKGEKLLDISPARRASQNYALDFQDGKLSFIVESNDLFIAAIADLRTASTKMIAYADTSFHQRTKDVEAVITLGGGIPLRLKLSPDGKTVLILRFSDRYGKKESFIDWWDLSSLNLIRTIPISGLEFPCWQVSWDLKKIAVWDYNGASLQERKKLNDYNKQFGSEPANVYTGIHIVDLNTGKLDDIDLDKIGVKRIGETSVRFVNAAELYILDTHDQILARVDIKKKVSKGTIDLSTYGFHERVGNFFTFAENSLIYSVHPWNDGYINQFRKWNLTSSRVVAQGNSNATRITALSETHDSGVFALGLSDNTISVRNTKDLAERYRIIQDDGGHYAFMTPDNFYKADRTSATALQFSWQNKSFALHQFDTWFNRPDKVLAATGFSRPSDIQLMEKAFAKRAKKSGSNGLTEMLEQALPLVSISNLETLPLQTSQDSVQIETLLSAPGKALAILRVSVNGVPVKNVHLQQSIKQKQDRLLSVWVPLTTGKNNISITANDSEGATSLPAEIGIELLSNRGKPDLYLFTVAINSYLNPDLNLHYAVKDARDIIHFFSHDKRFANVYVDSLFNTNVTASNVSDLRKKLQRAKRDDMVIVFFAGHGLLDENLDFRFATWAVDLNKPGETAILYQDIERLLDGIKPINKLLLMDACHSGSIDKDEISETTERLIRERYGDERAIVKQQTFGKIQHNVFKSGMIDRESFETMQDLFIAEGSETGAQVVVATAGDSYAIESNEWQNGFFTYALLSGLKTGRADQNQDRHITVDEIIRYLKDEVKRMSEGKQVPRLRAENPENYFELWRY